MDFIRAVLVSDSPLAALAMALIKASLVLGIVQSIVAAMPRASAATRHFLLTSGICAFLLIPLLAISVPGWSLTILPAPDPPPVSHLRSDAPIAQAPLWTDAHSVAAPAVVEERIDLSPSTIAMSVWTFGVLAVLARLLFCALRLRAIVRNALRPSTRLHRLLDDSRARIAPEINLRLLCSESIRVPMVWGIRSGTVLMPASAERWSDEQLRATFVHETGHLLRFDYFSLAIMNITSALLWFHPQVWIARRRALIEGERACDDLVLHSGARPSEYASHLLQVARLANSREPVDALLAMSRPSQLERRLAAILTTSANRTTPERKILMISLAMFLAAVAPLAAIQLAEAPPTPPPVPAAVTAPAPPLAVAAAPAARPFPAAAPSLPAARTAIRATPAIPEPGIPTPVAALPAVAPVPDLGELPPLPSAAPEPAHPVPALPADAVTPVAVRPAVAPRPSIPALPTPGVPVPPGPAPRPMTSEESAVPAPQSRPRTSAPPPPTTPRPVTDSSPRVPILSPADATAHEHKIIGAVKGRTCTVKLRRPVNTGDPAANPAELLATQRLLQRASKRGADAVINVQCYREISIGIGCPTAVMCEGVAISFSTPAPAEDTVAF